MLGAENVPREGGLVVAANHHNSVVDAMLLIAMFDRPLRTLANAPLFRHPMVGPFLRVIGALPVHRRQEAGNDPAKNNDLFSATTHTLREGGAIALFPEGRTQPEPVLLELRTGAARMLLAAEEGRTEQSVTLLPVGLVFDDPGTFRQGRALMSIGAPVSTRAAVALAATEPEPAARLLTDELASALRRQIVEAEDRQTFRLVGLVEELWREERGQLPMDTASRVGWLQRALRTHARLREQAPDRIASLRRRLDALGREMEAAGLSAAGLSHPLTPTRIARRIAFQSAALLVESPLALVGLALHLVPYQLTGVVFRRMPKNDEEVATDKIAIGIVLYPIFWVLELASAWALWGPWAAAAVLLALLPTAYFTLAWQERLERVRRELRTLAHCRRDPELGPRLLAARRSITEELQALSRLAPEEWPP